MGYTLYLEILCACGATALEVDVALDVQHLEATLEESGDSIRRKSEEGSRSILALGLSYARTEGNHWFRSVGTSPVSNPCGLMAPLP